MLTGEKAVPSFVRKQENYCFCLDTGDSSIVIFSDTANISSVLQFTTYVCLCLLRRCRQMILCPSYL